MIVKKELLIDLRRRKPYTCLTVFLEKRFDETNKFAKLARLNGWLIQCPYKLKEKILPAVLQLDVDLRPEEIQVEFVKNKTVIRIGTLTAELLVKQNKVTGKYGSDGDKIVLIKSSKGPQEENDLSILQLLVDNNNRRK